MSRIKTVMMSGFKGIDQEIALPERLVLSAPNGTGKSAILEAIVYAISGEVPSGKTNDEAAKFFGGRGGSVQLGDDNGDWIRRGIQIDEEKRKVSESAERQGHKVSPDNEVEWWHANQALLNMRDFLSLSPAKRRQFVLELVGAGELPSEDEVHRTLGDAYAKILAGPAANLQSLLSVELLDDLSLVESGIATMWPEIWTVFRSHMVSRPGGYTASDLFRTLQKSAADHFSGCRRAARDAKSAIRELGASLRGAEAAAAQLKRRKLELNILQEAWFRTQRDEMAKKLALDQVNAAREKLKHTEREAERLASEYNSTADELPEPDTEENRLPELRRDLAELQRILTRQQSIVAERKSLEDRIEGINSKIGETLQDLETAQTTPISRVVKYTAQLKAWYLKTGETWETFGQLEKAVDELSHSYRNHRRTLENRILDLEKQEEQTRDTMVALDEKFPDDRVIKHSVRVEELATKVAMLEREISKEADRELTQIEQRREWNAARDKRVAVEALLASKQKLCGQLRGELEELETKYDRLPDANTEAVKSDWEEAREAVGEAEKAAGAVQAYNDATERANRETIAEKAWKAAEAAVRGALETYVGEIVQPLVSEIQEILAAAGRSEAVYLKLENDRGKPIFDLGWVSGTSRRSLSSLSGGEAVLFTTALAVVISRRSTGRKILLIEADPLDELNLRLLLTSLAKIPDKFDACIVATSTPINSHEGWKISHMKEGHSMIPTVTA